LASLVKRIDKELADNESLRGYAVFLTDDADKTEKELESMYKDCALSKLPLTTFEGMAGPKSYKINKDADVTVHLWKGRKVTASFAMKLDDINEKAIEKVVDAIKKMGSDK
jgi:hypothetical protein